MRGTAAASGDVRGHVPAVELRGGAAGAARGWQRSRDILWAHAPGADGYLEIQDH